MIAYKGFNSDLSCTMGKGTYHYKIGETYTEGEAECTSTGFHCTEEPLAVLQWYKKAGDRYCLIEAGGDIHEDGTATRLAATKIRLVKELTLTDLYRHECWFIIQHPKRELVYKVKREKGTAEQGHVIIRGRNPKGRGKKGDYIFLLREDGQGEITEAAALEVDGKKIRENRYYGMEAAE